MVPRLPFLPLATVLLAGASSAASAPSSGAVPEEPFVDSAPAGAAAALRELVPESLREGSFAGLETWQWLALLVLILVGLVAEAVGRPLLAAIAKRVASRPGHAIEEDEWNGAARAWAWLATALLWLGGLHLIGLAGLAQLVLVNAARVFLSLTGVWACWRGVDLAAGVFRARASRTLSKVDDVLVPLLRRAGKIFVAAIGLVYIADGLSIDIAPLLASLGLGGLAFAFAAKDTIENFFGSVAVLADQPFLVGDWVVIGDTEGTVERIGFRSTRIRTFHDSLVTVPNAMLVRTEVDNFGRRRFRRIKTTIGLHAATPPEAVVAFCEGLRELVRLHPSTRKDSFHVAFRELGESSLDVLLYCFLAVENWGSELRERERLLLDVLHLAAGLGVSLATPAREVLLVQAKEEDAAEPAGPVAADSGGDPAERGRSLARALAARHGGDESESPSG